MCKGAFCASYRGNTVEMTLFRKYEAFYSERKRYLIVGIKKDHM